MIPSFGTHPKPRPTIAGKGVMGGKVGSGGKGLGLGGMKRHRYVGEGRDFHRVLVARLLLVVWLARATEAANGLT